MKKPIKSNLFKFVTLRSPQLIEEKNKERLFVTYPKNKEGESRAIIAGKNATTQKEKIQALKKAHDTPDFTPILSKVSYNDSSSQYNSYQKIYRFSNWLMRNKNNLSFLSVVSNIGGVEKISQAQELLIWENLFYQTIRKESVSVRESLIQILVANKFLKAFEEFDSVLGESSIGSGQEESRREGDALVLKGKRVELQGPIKIGDGVLEFTEEEKKYFTQIANSSVVIPKEALAVVKKQVKYNSSISDRALQFLSKTTLANKARVKLEKYQRALKDLNKAQFVHNKEEEKKYQKAIQAYRAKIKETQDTGSSGSLAARRAIVEGSSSLEIERIDNQLKGSSVSNVEKLEIPYVKFSEIVRLPKDGSVTPTESESKVLSQLSIETQGVINSPDLEIYDSFDDVKAVLEENIKVQNEVVLDAVSSEVVSETINGENVLINLEDQIPFHFYTGDLNCDRLTGDCSINMLLKVDINNVSGLVFAKDITYDILDSNNNVLHSGTHFAINYIGKDDYIRLEFFKDNKIQLKEGRYKFRGKFTLSTGVTLAFDEDDFKVVFDDGIYDTHIVGQCLVSGGVESVSEEEKEEGVIYGVTQLGIADFRRVEQEVCCYVPGEVSRIENIMASEFKERSTRNLTSDERISEKNSEKEAEVLTDTSSTQRFEMQNEASSIVNKDNSTSFGANASVSGSAFGASFSAGTNINTSSGNSISNSNLQAQTYAEEVTERALERVVEKVSSKRVSHVLKEYEENTTHGFDNRKGKKNITGVYRWLDIIYENKLVNYGKRLMYEFAIPEPAKFFIDNYGVKKKEDKSCTVKIVKPEKPIHPSKVSDGISGASSLSSYNYQKFASLYNAEVFPYPKKEISIGESFNLTYVSQAGKIESASGKGEVEIPKGYVSSLCKVSFSSIEDGHRASKGFWVNVGDVSFNDVSGRAVLNVSSPYRSIERYIERIPVSFLMGNYFEGSLNVSVRCRLSKEGEEQWQNETYKAIIDAYNERLKEYNDFVQAEGVDETEVEKRKEFSFQLNRSVEKQELKRIAIDLMIEPYGLGISQGNYKEGSCIEVYKTSDFEKHASIVKFFEQAFDWEVMAYTFYPYFYKKRGDWAKSFDYSETNDPVFKAFLQSGMARTVVPVRPGFEDAVNWYMNTGEIWNGQGMVTDVNDELYVSIAEEMKETKGEIEGTWETRVPTSLTILQSESVILEEGGLPCNPDCDDDTSFKSSSNILGGGTSDDPEGVDFDIIEETNNIT